jgi:hypothetical protein
VIRLEEVERVTGQRDADISLAAREHDSRISAWGAKAKENLSLYGISSVSKLIAESVAQNVLGTPGDLSQQVIMILLE